MAEKDLTKSSKTKRQPQLGFRFRKFVNETAGVTTGKREFGSSAPGLVPRAPSMKPKRKRDAAGILLE